MNKLNLNKLKKIENKNYYNLKNYKLILNTLKLKYKFCKFGDKNKKDKYIIYLRHDIDFSPIPVLKLLKIYKDLKIKANFYFMISNHNYNILSKQNLKIINQIKKSGHCIGLHLEEKNNYKCLKTDYAYFKKILNISNSVSFHIPSKKTLYKKFSGFINAYEKKFFNIDNYASDLERKVSFLKKVINLIELNKKEIQLLVHPMWWCFDKDQINKYMIEVYKKEYLKYIKSLKLDFKL